MEHNLGKYDKQVRFGVGVSLALVGFLSDKVSGALKYVLIVVGLYLVLSGLAGFCVLYKACKISTNKVSDADMKDLMK